MFAGRLSIVNRALYGGMNMQSQSPHYEATVQQHGSEVYVDVLADDCKKVMSFIRCGRVECSSAQISPTEGRVVFEPGTKLDRARYIMCQYDEMHSPSAKAHRTAGE